MKTVLITNDDGVVSPGIAYLQKELEQSCRVYVVAPDRERSAISMALTLHHPLRLNPISERVFAVDGTTADCVNLAFQKLMPEKPDFVISGMNLGENLAEDIFFSGTVGGAFSAILYGVPALAVSLVGELEPGRTHTIDFSDAARITASVMETLHPQASSRVVYNLNIPFPHKGNVMVTSLGSKRYTPDIIERKDPRGRAYYWIGTGLPEYRGKKGTDIWAIQNGRISLTPVYYDFHSDLEYNRLSSLFTE